MKPPSKLLEQGACIGKSAHLFDAMTVEDAQEALHLCSKCWVKRECLAWMQPNRRFYDGVAGGRLWADGQVIEVSQLGARLRDRMRRAPNNATARDDNGE